MEWQQGLSKGDYASQADIARKLKISRARVTQILCLLNLNPRVLEMIVSLGDPMPSRIVTERLLRPLIDKTHKEQTRIVEKLAKRSHLRPKSDEQ
jgi:hypothetical protein